MMKCSLKLLSWNNYLSSNSLKLKSNLCTAHTILRRVKFLSRALADNLSNTFLSLIANKNLNIIINGVATEHKDRIEIF